MTYAKGTSVSISKTRIELETLLVRAGATRIVSGLMPSGAGIMFDLRDRRIRIDLPLPAKDEKRFVFKPNTTYWKRSAADAEKAWEQACRERWRGLLLVLKAKLEAVESGIVTFEREWLAHIVLPDGRTVAECVGPQIAAAYEGGGSTPLLLPAAGCSS